MEFALQIEPSLATATALQSSLLFPSLATATALQSSLLFPSLLPSQARLQSSYSLSLSSSRHFWSILDLLRKDRDPVSATSKNIPVWGIFFVVQSRISPTSVRTDGQSKQNIPDLGAHGQSRISPKRGYCEYPQNGDIKTYEKTHQKNIPDLGAHGQSRISPTSARLVGAEYPRPRCIRPEQNIPTRGYSRSSSQQVSLFARDDAMKE